MRPLEGEQLTLFPEDFPASRFPLPESKKGKTTPVTSGRRCSESFQSCVPSGSSGRMCLDSFESHLTTSLTVSSRKATQRGHMLSRLKRSAHLLQEKGSLLWPRPTTGAPLCGGTHNFQQMMALKEAGIITEEERRNLTQGNGGKSNPGLLEWLMGFPIGWTDCDASATPSCRSSSTQSSAQ